MVPAGSDQVSRARPYSGARQGRRRAFAYGTVTRCGPAFQPVRLTRRFVTSRPAGRRIEASPTTLARQRLPPITSHEFGLIPFRSPLLRESRFLSFPPGTKMFQFPGLPLLPYGFRQGYARITTRGFPHSEIPGSTDGQLLPGAYRSRPRPSSALGAKASTVCPSSLDSKEHVYCRYGVFKVRVSDMLSLGSTHEKTRPTDGLSKLNSVRPRESEPGYRAPAVRPVEVDVRSRRVQRPDGPRAIDRRQTSITKGHSPAPPDGAARLPEYEELRHSLERR